VLPSLDDRDNQCQPLPLDLRTIVRERELKLPDERDQEHVHLDDPARVTRP
jgi:hypothetical protein